MAEGVLVTEVSVLEIARSYTAAGLSVVPIGLDGRKQPFFSLLPDEWDEDQAKYHAVWKPFQSRIPTDDELQRWFSTLASSAKLVVGRHILKPAAIGIVMGVISGGAEAIDVDWPEVAVDFKREVKQQWPELHDLLCWHQTPSDGLHCIYRCAEIDTNQKLAWPNKAECEKAGRKFKAYIETRGEAGYIVAPGSPIDAHETKKPYQHLDGPPLTNLRMITEDARNWLWALAKSYDRSETSQKAPSPQHEGTGLSPADDFDCRGPSFQELLEGTGCELVSGDWDCGKIRRPGQDASPYGATVGYCRGRKHKEPLLHVFTTSWPPFEPGNYGKFHVLRLLKFQGDGSKAMAWCRQQGYGEKRKGTSNGKVGANGHASVSAKGEWEKDAGPYQQQAQVIDEPWEPTIPLENPVDSPMPFPIELLPKKLAQLANEICDATNAPPDFPAVVSLGLAAGCIGASLKLEIKPGRTASASLYICTVGRKGRGKSPTMTYLQPPLVKEQIKRRKEKNKVPSFLEDVTTERLKRILQDDQRGQLMIFDELKSWFGGFNQYRSKGVGTDRQFFLSAWSGAPVTVHRNDPTKEDVFIPHPTLSIVGGIQPSVLGNCQRTTDDDGLFDRILFSYPVERPAVGERWRVVSSEATTAWADAIQRLRGLDMVVDDEENPRPRFIKMTEGAKKSWEDWTNWLATQRQSPDYPDWLEGPAIKMEDYGARLALVIFALREVYGEHSTSMMDRDSMERGAAICRYFLAHAHRVYSSMGRDPRIEQAKKVLLWIERNDRPMFRRSEVWDTVRKGSMFSKPEDLNGPLYLLEQHRFIRRIDEERSPKSGRPKTLGYQVSPYLFHHPINPKNPNNPDCTASDGPG